MQNFARRIAIAALCVTACPAALGQSATPVPPAGPLPPASPVAPIPPPPPAPLPPEDVLPALDLSSRVQPTFPGFDAVYALGGQVVLDVTVADTGAIIDIRVEESSGHRELDDSAENAVRQWHFRPGDRQGTPVGGVVRVPINFDPLPSGQVPHNRLWPEAYAHPRYVVDPTPIPYASVDEAFKQVPADAHRPLADAHAIEQLQVHDAYGRLVTWWIFTDLGTPDAMAVRMAFAGTDDDPVVEVSSLCARAWVCTARRATLLHGPVYARSP
jgi:TonB family protein